MNYFFIYLSCSFAVVSTCLGVTKDSNTQDAEEYPLANNHSFSFIANTPAFGPLFNSVNIVIENELKKVGIVQRKEMLVQTDQGEAVDLTGFNAKAFLVYEISDLLAIDGSSLGVIIASLKLSTSICKTRACIWSSDCYIKGDTKKELEKSVSETAHFLIQKFNADYSKYNKEKPHFNFVVS